jgi:hypothetical protein
MALAEERVKSKGPIKDIYSLLANRELSIRNEQQEHERIADQQRTECAEEEEFRSREITDGAASAEAASGHRAQCASSKAEAQKTIGVKQGNLADKISEKKQLGEIRVAETELYNDRRADHERAIEALEAAQELFASRAQLVTPA